MVTELSKYVVIRSFIAELVTTNVVSDFQSYKQMCSFHFKPVLLVHRKIGCTIHAYKKNVFTSNDDITLSLLIL